MEKLKKRYPIEYTDGEIKMVEMPSLYHSEEIKCRFNDIINMLLNLDIRYIDNYDLLITLYLENGIFKHLINELFNIFKLDVEKIKITELFNLILPYKIEDNKVSKYGKLLEFTFEKPKSNTESIKPKPNVIDEENTDFIEKTIGTIWAVTKNFNETLFLISNFSSTDINKIIEARGYAEMPAEQKNKKIAQDKAKKTLQKMAKKGTSKIKKELSTNEVEDILGKFL